MFLGGSFRFLLKFKICIIIQALSVISFPFSPVLKPLLLRLSSTVSESGGYLEVSQTTRLVIADLFVTLSCHVRIAMW